MHSHAVGWHFVLATTILAGAIFAPSGVGAEPPATVVIKAEALDALPPIVVPHHLPVGEFWNDRWVSGNAASMMKARIRLRDAPSAVALTLAVEGKTIAHLTTHSPSSFVFSQGGSQTTSVKEIVISNAEVAFAPARTKSHSQMSLVGVEARRRGLPGAIARRVSARKYHKELDQNVARLNQRVTEETQKGIDQWVDRHLGSLRAPLQSMLAATKTPIHLRSTKERISITAGDDDSIPTPTADAPISLRIPALTVERWLNEALAGQRVDVPSLTNVVGADDEEQAPAPSAWHATFEKNAPFAVAFDDDRIQVELHCADATVGGLRLGATRIRAELRLQPARNLADAVRAAELRVAWAPSAEEGTSETPAHRIRAALRARLAWTTTLEKIIPADARGPMNQIQLVHLSARDGVLAIDADLRTEAEPASARMGAVRER